MREKVRSKLKKRKAGEGVDNEDETTTTKERSEMRLVDNSNYNL